MLNNKGTVFRAILWICAVRHLCLGFSPPQYHKIRFCAPSTSTTALSAATFDDDNAEDYRPTNSRREWMRATANAVFTTTIAMALLANSMPNQAMAAVESGDIIWKTGKAPIVPGKTQDKGDVKGTRKDPNFLRSVADCKGKCENSYDSDGLARSATECLQACQDICCTTYEQCTFTIVR